MDETMEMGGRICKTLLKYKEMCGEQVRFWQNKKREVENDIFHYRDIVLDKMEREQTPAPPERDAGAERNDTAKI